MKPPRSNEIDAFECLADGYDTHLDEITRFMLASNDRSAKNHWARVLGCCLTHLLLRHKSNGEFMALPISCNSRWCERCADRRQFIMAAFLAEQLSHRRMKSVCFDDDEACYVENTEDARKLRHFVFTVKNCYYSKLPAAISLIGAAVRRLTQWYQANEITYVWHIETTFNARDCHPHLHVMINKFVPLDIVHAIFRRAVAPMISSIAYASKFQCSLSELTKYHTKPSAWKKAPDRAATHIWRAMNRTRVIGCSRDLKLWPVENLHEWISLGCLERLADKPDSEFRGVAWQFLTDDGRKTRRRTITRRRMIAVQTRIATD